MSLYNALFGENPMAEVLLSALGLTRDGVPRYRDVYLGASPEGEPRIVIHTRTGGGNREFYECEESCRANYPEYFKDTDEPPTGPWNADLRKLPTFVRDEDDDFDCTYADFYFKVPPAFAPLIATLQEIGAGKIEKPSERWEKLFADMKSGEQTDDAKRAQEVGKAIFEKLQPMIDKGESGIVTV